MEYCGLPARPVTPRWLRLGGRAAAVMDGALGFLGLLLVFDAFRSFRSPDASLLGVLLRLPGGVPLPSWAGLVLGPSLLLRRRWLAPVPAAFALLAAANIAEFYLLRSRGLRAAALPFSAVTLALLAAAVARPFHDIPAARRAWRAAGAAAAGPALLLLHLVSFGSTDYARPAEAVVVLGARVYGDGRPSLALEDRVRHGIRLWAAGTAPVLVMSGAPDETPVMRRMALEAGVPEGAVVEDPEGVNTRATLANLRHRRVVAVSHYYHMARIKMAARRRGVACATSPCGMSRRLAREPWFVARECAAFVSYYLFRC
jgi:uncharacterized SAM-binding protein YcdF (DUF218 family)